LVAFGSHDPEVVSEYVVLCANHQYDDEGDLVTRHPMLVSPDLPYYRILGLLEMHLLKIRTQIQGD